jgi:hypothetical protein
MATISGKNSLPLDDSKKITTKNDKTLSKKD